jgi:hypothetical protein
LPPEVTCTHARREAPSARRRQRGFSRLHPRAQGSTRNATNATSTHARRGIATIRPTPMRSGGSTVLIHPHARARSRGERAARHPMDTTSPHGRPPCALRKRLAYYTPTRARGTGSKLQLLQPPCGRARTHAREGGTFPSVARGKVSFGKRRPMIISFNSPSRVPERTTPSTAWGGCGAHPRWQGQNGRYGEYMGNGVSQFAAQRTQTPKIGVAPRHLGPRGHLARAGSSPAFRTARKRPAAAQKGAFGLLYGVKEQRPTLR